MPANAHPRYLPVAGILIGASLWGVIWFPMRALEAGGLHGLWLTLILYASALIASLPFTWWTPSEFSRRPMLVALLMLAAGWTNIAFVEAVLGGNILRVLLLFYLSPLWAVLLGRFLLRETITRSALTSIVVAMGGAIIMLWDTRLGVPWPQGRTEWLALSSGFAFAVSNVIVRKMDNVSVAGKAAAVWLGVVLLALTIIGLNRAPAPPLAGPVFSGAVALGVFGILLMTVFVQYGVTHMPVHRSAVLALIELVAGAISQQLLTDEVVSVREWIGGAMIVAGAWLAARATIRH